MKNNVFLSGPFAFHYLYRYDREVVGDKWGWGVSLGGYMAMAFCGSDDENVYIVLDSGDVKKVASSTLAITDIYTEPSPLFLQAAWFNPSDCSEIFGAVSGGTG